MKGRRFTEEQIIGVLKEVEAGQRSWMSIGSIHALRSTMYLLDALPILP